MENLWREEISTKPSLRYLSHHSVEVGKTHHIYATVRPNIQDIQRAELKARIITGTYILQANRARFNQNEVDSTCKICKKSPETREHFIAACQELAQPRRAFNRKVTNLLSLQPDVLKELDHHTYTQLVLDCTHHDIPYTLPQQKTR
jgi:hypothetical protein